MAELDAGGGIRTIGPRCPFVAALSKFAISRSVLRFPPSSSALLELNPRLRRLSAQRLAWMP